MRYALCYEYDEYDSICPFVDCSTAFQKLRALFFFFFVFHLPFIYCLFFFPSFLALLS
jgi:hypothetical protein